MQVPALKGWPPNHQLLHFALVFDVKRKFKDIAMVDFLAFAQEIRKSEQLIDLIPSPVVTSLVSAFRVAETLMQEIDAPPNL